MNERPSFISNDEVIRQSIPARNTNERISVSNSRNQIDLSRQSDPLETWEEGRELREMIRRLSPISM